MVRSCAAFGARNAVQSKVLNITGGTALHVFYRYMPDRLNPHVATDRGPSAVDAIARMLRRPHLRQWCPRRYFRRELLLGQVCSSVGQTYCCITRLQRTCDDAIRRSEADARGTLIGLTLRRMRGLLPKLMAFPPLAATDEARAGDSRGRTYERRRANCRPLSRH